MEHVMKRLEDRLWCSLASKNPACRADHHLSDSELLLGYCSLGVEIMRITTSQSSDNSSVVPLYIFFGAFWIQYSKCTPFMVDSGMYTHL